MFLGQFKDSPEQREVTTICLFFDAVWIVISLKWPVHLTLNRPFIIIQLNGNIWSLKFDSESSECWAFACEDELE